MKKKNNFISNGFWLFPYFFSSRCIENNWKQIITVTVRHGSVCSTKKTSTKCKTKSLILENPKREKSLKKFLPEEIAEKSIIDNGTNAKRKLSGTKLRGISQFEWWTKTQRHRTKLKHRVIVETENPNSRTLIAFNSIDRNLNNQNHRDRVPKISKINRPSTRKRVWLNNSIAGRTRNVLVRTKEIEWSEDAESK